MLETRGSVSHDCITWSCLDACWRAGSLEHLLDETQLEIYRFIRASESSTVYVCASRQLGKSFVDVVIALEDCIRNPAKRVNYVAKTFGSLKKMVEQTMGFIIDQAPPDCCPVFLVSESRWEFPVEGPARGAFIQLVGADETRGADRCRGGAVVRNIIDEAGFIDCLEYLLNSVLKPMGLRTGAQTILSTSPALSPDHYSCSVEDVCAANGALITRDFWSPGMQSREEKTKFLEAEAQAVGMSLEQFMKTSTYRREYGCERVIDRTLAVVPEWEDVSARALAAGKAAVRPPFFDLYFAGDPGMSDKFGGLFGYHDFRRNRFVIEHELLLPGANTKAFAEAYQKVLIEQYPCPQDDPRSMRLVTADSAFNVLRPRSAVLDDRTGRICADLWAYNGLQFAAARPPDREAAINAMRLEIASRIEVHPRCVQLTRQLEVAVRTKPGGDMARSATHGHYDLISSLWYLVPSIEWARNPYPADHGFDRHTQTMRERPPPQSLSQVVLRGTSLSRRR